MLEEQAERWKRKARAQRWSAQAEGGEDCGKPLAPRDGAGPLARFGFRFRARMCASTQRGRCGKERPAEVGAEDGTAGCSEGGDLVP
jgi:hypothetical protein